MSEKSKWIIVVIFAAAMAWVESAVVVYLRTLIDRVEPYQANPLPIFGGLGHIELGREVATLVMLLTVGWLAGKTWRSRIAYAAIAFGVWDISYYIFLVPMSGWPRSIFDWDILFLLPLPWWGPVIAPASIAALMIVGGTLMVWRDARIIAPMPRRLTWGLSCIGTMLALYVFMADTLRASSDGAEAIRNVLPTSFDWGLFALAFALMSAPIVNLGWQLWARRRQSSVFSHQSSD
ncbi:MAG: hypothetical protein FJ009_00720 [Chloroflexi bacterium]|nr:hypothetical protein [Chloroflexota bacterium]